MAVTWTRRYRFQSVHALHTGVHRERRHGHSYALEVSFEGCPPALVDQEVAARVLPRLHGRELSGDLEPATGEVLSNWIHARLSESPAGPFLRAVALQETRKNRFLSAESEVRFV